MNKLQYTFPNFIEAIEYMKNGTDLKLETSNDSKIKYTMSFIILNKRLGNINAELNKVNNEGVIFSFSTLKGIIVKAKTTSENIKHDLSVEDWLELINKTMITHNHSLEHQKILLEYSNNERLKNESKKSGCASIILIPSIISLILYLSLNN